MNREIGKNNLEQTKDTVQEINESAEKRASDAEQVNSILQGINLDGLTSDDVSALDETKSGYSKDYQSAISQEVSEPTNEVDSKGQEDISGLNESKDQVDVARDSFNEAAGVSEIGASNAEKASSKMEDSSSQYEQIIDEYNSTLEQAKENASNAQSRIENLF
jgi:hypothetical protein